MLSALLAGNTLLNAQYPHHVIHAVINHSTQEITVTDTIKFPAVMMDNSSIWEFTLNSNLILENTGADISIEKIENHGDD